MTIRRRSAGGTGGPVAAGARGLRGEAGQALAEFVFVLPLLMLFLFGIIEMGAAWRSYQVITNAAREGARIAVLPSADEPRVVTAVSERLDRGGLDSGLATIQILCDAGEGECFGSGRAGAGTEVQVSFPFTFRVLGTVVAYVGGGAESFGTITLRTGIVMRNE